MAETVLLVDDDADVVRAVGDYFERLGYEVAREGTGEGGMAIRQSEHAQRRLDRAHRRLMSSLRTLATVRRLLADAGARVCPPGRGEPGSGRGARSSRS